MKFQTVKSGRSILYIEGFHKKKYISFSEDRVKITVKTLVKNRLCSISSGSSLFVIVPVYFNFI